MTPLGSLILDPKRISLMAIDQTELTVSELIVYNALLEMHRLQVPIDFMTLTAYLYKAKQLEAVGGMQVVARWIE